MIIKDIRKTLWILNISFSLILKVKPKSNSIRTFRHSLIQLAMPLLIEFERVYGKYKHIFGRFIYSDLSRICKQKSHHFELSAYYFPSIDVSIILSLNPDNSKQFCSIRGNEGRKAINAAPIFKTFSLIPLSWHYLKLNALIRSKFFDRNPSLSTKGNRQ